MKSLWRFLIIGLILIACKDDEEGTIQFTFNAKGSVRLVESEPHSIKLVLKDKAGKIVLDKTIPVSLTGNSYLSENVQMKAGAYAVTGFDVLDNQNNVIYSAPMEGSDRANLVSDPLDVTTNILSGEQTKLTIEVLATKYNRALSFDGIDDYVSLGNLFDNMQLPVSVSAWLWVDPNKTSQIPIFVSHDNPSVLVYKGFYLIINPTHLFTGYGDGLGTNNSMYRSDLSGQQSGPFGKWIHVAGVIRGPQDMDVYIDGIALNKVYTGGSSSPMASNFPTAVAKIGTWTTNAKSHYSKGMIDEVKVWNKALTSADVTLEMIKRPIGGESGLVGYWNFDETDGNVAMDHSGLNQNGSIVGAIRVAAPIDGF